MLSTPFFPQVAPVTTAPPEIPSPYPCFFCASLSLGWLLNIPAVSARASVELFDRCMPLASRRGWAHSPSDLDAILFIPMIEVKMAESSFCNPHAFFFEKFLIPYSILLFFNLFSSCLIFPFFCATKFSLKCFYL